MKQFMNGEVSAGQLCADFSDDVFEHKEKGELLKAMLLTATGHRFAGEEQLDAYITKITLKKNSRKGINSKTQLLLNRAMELKKGIEEDPDHNKFQEQFKIESHGHKDPITWVNFSVCNQFLGAISKDMTTLWRVFRNTAEKVMTLDANEDGVEDGSKPVICVSEGAQKIAVSRGNLKFTVY